ncbi:MAG: 4-(cytidine 5'-diphospho)-2-C-methyl-D-erythritol kinase [Christensenellales bacterium]
MLLKARAKINWSLNITGKRPDGYHELDSIMHSIDVYDLVNIDKASEVEITCKGLMNGEGNIAYKAAQLFLAEANITGGAKIHIEKHTPIEAGLGGGSANAAAVLVGLNRLYDMKFTMPHLMKLGLKLGADVPFCIKGGFARAKGVGENLSFLPDMTYTLLLVKPVAGLPTVDVFRKYDEIGGDTACIDDMISGLLAKNIKKMKASYANALQRPSEMMNNDITKIMALLAARGSLMVGMTGSGPTVFSLFASDEKLKEACAGLEGFWVQKTVTKPYGITVEPEA